MKNEIVSLSLGTDSIIAIIGIVVTILIPVIGGIYKIVTSTKKYELTENYRKELLQWYTSVVEIMIRIIHSMESQEFFSDEFQPQKMEMLSRLSALTEIGRFYFPNVIKGDYFGHDKPSAYQGYRDICLEFLVYFYNTALKSVDDSNVATVYKGNIIKNLIMDCQSYTKYRPNETTGGIFVSWRRKEELPTGA